MYLPVSFPYSSRFQPSLDFFALRLSTIFKRLGDPALQWNIQRISADIFQCTLNYVIWEIPDVCSFNLWIYDMETQDFHQRVFPSGHTDGGGEEDAELGRLGGWGGLVEARGEAAIGGGYRGEG